MNAALTRSECGVDAALQTRGVNEAMTRLSCGVNAALHVMLTFNTASMRRSLRRYELNAALGVA